MGSGWPSNISRYSSSEVASRELAVASSSVFRSSISPSTRACCRSKPTLGWVTAAGGADSAASTACRIAAGEEGFRSTCWTPHRSARDCVSLASNVPVKKMMRVSAMPCSSRKRRTSSYPSIPGISRSVMMRSGWTERHNASASSPLDVSRTRWPHLVRSLRRNLRMSGWSSTIRMVAKGGAHSRGPEYRGESAAHREPSPPWLNCNRMATELYFLIRNYVRSNTFRYGCCKRAGESSSPCDRVPDVPLVLQFDQFFPHAILGQFRIIPQAHFLQGPSSVSADGLHAQMDLSGDFAHRLARGNAQHNVVFPIRQAFVERLGKVAAQIGGERFPHARADKFPAGQHLADGGQQNIGRTSLVEVPGCARAQCAGGKLLLRVRTQNEDGKPGTSTPDLFQDIEPGASRQRQIQDNQIPGPVVHRSEE